MNSTLQPDRREFTLATASLAVAATLPAATASAAPTPVRGGTLKVAQCSANRRTADATNARHPYFFVDLSTRVAYNCLTWVNEKLEWEPELAREVVATDDKLNVWDVAIREGVLFHDGREMTSADGSPRLRPIRRVPRSPARFSALRDWANIESGST